MLLMPRPSGRDAMLLLQWSNLGIDYPMSIFRRRYTERGAPPGSVAPEQSEVMPKIFGLSYGPDSMSEVEPGSASEALALIGGREVAWIDVRGLGDGSIVQELGEGLGLHGLAVSDVVNVGQRPKVEIYDDFLFVVLRMVTLGADGRLHWEQVSLFLGQNYVLTFQETHLDCLEPLRARIRSGRKLLRSSDAEYLAFMVVDAIVDGYFPVLEHYGERLESLERQILDEGRRDTFGELYLTKRDLAGFRRAAWPLREALSHLMRGEERQLSDSARLHLRDTLDHTMQIVEVNESYRELAVSLVDVHLSMVGQRTNDVMRVLAIVSTVFIPLSFVAGVYGMNFDRSSPWNLPELGWPHGYLYFWSICLLLVSSLLLLFRKLGWLKS
ncbi:MAG: magnesium transporter [Planctomycetota bacterium]